MWLTKRLAQPHHKFQALPGAGAVAEFTQAVDGLDRGVAVSIGQDGRGFQVVQTRPRERSLLEMFDFFLVNPPARRVVSRNATLAPYAPPASLFCSRDIRRIPLINAGEMTRS